MELFSKIKGFAKTKKTKVKTLFMSVRNKVVSSRRKLSIRDVFSAAAAVEEGFYFAIKIYEKQQDDFFINLYICKPRSTKNTQKQKYSLFQRAPSSC